ncbi:right-handed parallel beta-helix repeat-containing protein [Natronorarus salvus]|uniref:right-handed parallel beta-helix repeat-containing protein n=1 Tax=Natronorarus salvus TaxID=3117733 RepID=UPI002F26BC28
MSGDHERTCGKRTTRRTYLRRSAASVAASAITTGVLGSTGADARADRFGSEADPTPVTGPTRITEPGEYVLTRDVTVAEGELCIVVDVAAVDFDGGGHTIAGGDPAVLVLDHEVVVRSLTVADSRSGVVFDSVRGGTVVDTTVTSPRLSGIEVSATSNSTVRRTTVTDATTGLVCFEADRNLLSGNTVTGCERSGIDLLDSTANLIAENVSTGNDEHGLALTNSEGNVVRGNSLPENGLGPCSVVDSSANLFEGNDPVCDGEGEGTDASPGPLV